MDSNKKLKNTFSKAERLCSKNKIDLLFKHGITKRTGCIRMIYLLDKKTTGASVQVIFSVPKKQLRKAVQRNLIRRRMREAYRLNKNILGGVFKQDTKQLLLAFLFIENSEESFQIIEKSIKELLSVIKM